MPIVVNLDVMMARRHKGAGELAEEIGITPANLSILKITRPRLCGFRRWRLSAGRWTASRGIFWSLCRTRIGRAGHARPATFPQANVLGNTA